MVAADVYAVKPHIGRAGWSWYTGSAGWLYRLIIESLLGLHREGDRLRLLPCIPAEWTHYSMTYRFGSTSYQLAIKQVNSDIAIAGYGLVLDNEVLTTAYIPLLDDQATHHVLCTVTRQTPPIQK